MTAAVEPGSTAGIEAGASGALSQVTRPGGYD